MGHAAFGRLKEDRQAYKSALKAEEERWASMASPVTVTFKDIDPKITPLKAKRSRRAKTKYF